MDFLKQIQDAELNFVAAIDAKLESGIELNDLEVENYRLKETDEEIIGYLNRVLDGEYIPGFNVKDFLASPQAKVLIPKIVIGNAKKAQDPIYLASKMFKKIKLKNGSSIQFPVFGVMRAYDVAEA